MGYAVQSLEPGLAIIFGLMFFTNFMMSALTVQDHQVPVVFIYVETVPHSAGANHLVHVFSLMLEYSDQKILYCSSTFFFFSFKNKILWCVLINEWDFFPFSLLHELYWLKGLHIEQYYTMLWVESNIALWNTILSCKNNYVDFFFWLICLTQKVSSTVVFYYYCAY